MAWPYEFGSELKEGIKKMQTVGLWGLTVTELEYTDLTKHLASNAGNVVV